MNKSLRTFKSESYTADAPRYLRIDRRWYGTRSHVDCGDNVIIINAEKVEVTGKKRKEKIYKRHTGYPGGLREITFEKLQAKKPEEIIRHAVKGMLPDGKLGRQMYKKLKVYAGPEHPHTAQKPETWEF